GRERGRQGDGGRDDGGAPEADRQEGREGRDDRRREDQDDGHQRRRRDERRRARGGREDDVREDGHRPRQLPDQGRDEGGAREVHAPQGRVVGRRPPGRLALGSTNHVFERRDDRRLTARGSREAGCRLRGWRAPLVFSGSPSWYTSRSGETPRAT